MKKPIAVIDLYCGMGGFTQGAVEAGATVILSCDFWDEAVKVHKLNHPGIPCLQLKLGSPSDWKLIKQYIDKYPNYHIHLHGSPPCQALSNASSTDPSKGMPLILHFLDLIEKLNPDSWSMENVVPMRKRLPEGTPSVVLNSADYGVPQTRRRCIAGKGWLANPSHSKEEWVSVIQALPHLENELSTHLNTSGAGQSNSRRAKSVDSILTKPSKTLHNNRPTLRLIKLEALGSNSKRNQDRTILEPSKTICGSGNQVGSRIFNHEEKPVKIRSLTIEETLIIQGFNPNYDLSSTKTKKSRWTMVGNAVCPPVARAIIEGIHNG
jgi:DNA (cytosine-5)-methyltransferase 1